MPAVDGDGYGDAVADISRQADTAQDERLQLVDIAVPTEVLVTRMGSPDRLSLYVGPRIAIEHYHDVLDPSQSVTATYVGVLGGIHFNAGIFHAFAEATLIHVPGDQYKGQTYGGYWTVLPTVAIVLHTGKAHGWQAPR